MKQKTSSASDDAACSPWLSMDDAPRDGAVILGKYGNDAVEIRWAENRRCMLAGVGGGNGYFGAGWEDEYNGLYMDDPEAWKPEESHVENSVLSDSSATSSLQSTDKQ